MPHWPAAFDRGETLQPGEPKLLLSHHRTSPLFLPLQQDSLDGLCPSEQPRPVATVGREQSELRIKISKYLGARNRVSQGSRAFLCLSHSLPNTIKPSFHLSCPAVLNLASLGTSGQAGRVPHTCCRCSHAGLSALGWLDQLSRAGQMSATLTLLQREPNS